MIACAVRLIRGLLTPLGYDTDEEWIDVDAGPHIIGDADGLRDTSLLDRLCDQVIAEHPGGEGDA